MLAAFSQYKLAVSLRISTKELARKFGPTKPVPSNVSALPLVATLLPFRYSTPLAVPPERVRLLLRVAVETVKLVPEMLVMEAEVLARVEIVPEVLVRLVRVAEELVKLVTVPEE